MSVQRAVISYATSLSLHGTDQWKHIYGSLLSQFPLHNLHWKSPSRPNIRSIQELEVNLLPLETFRDEHSSQVPQTVLDRPLLNLYIVVCEDNDTYKNSVKKQIKDWHASIIQRKNQEWLIVHVAHPESKAIQGGVFQSSVLDKIRTDFNLDKRDRCVQLVLSSDYDNPTIWAEFINKVKDGILSAFDAALLQREEEVKRSEGQRQMPGWNFCTFFILKESLASSFQGMNLFEDALQQYDELEYSFFQVLREKNLSWFGNLISPGPKDDSLPLLSVDKKGYRDMILVNAISVFDFRVYLLARQCELLSKMRNVVEIGRKVVAFLCAFGRRLRDVEGALPTFFIESWIYSSALSVVDQCDLWAGGLDSTSVPSASFSAVRGELLDLARSQLDIIGIKIQYLPERPPFSLALPTPELSHPGSPQPVEPAPPTQTLTNEQLLKAIEEKQVFYEIYVKLTKRAIDLYANAGRRKFALKLHGSLAALDLHRGLTASALTTYTSLPAHYSAHGWTSLEAFMLNRAITIHDTSDKGKGKDEEWIHVLLKFLKVYVGDMGKELLMDEESHEAYITTLLEALKDAATSLPSELVHPDHPALSVTIADGNARLAGDQDGALLDVVVHNRLPCNLPCNRIEVVLSGRETTRLTFMKDLEQLPAGSTKLTLFCPSSSPGTYSLHSNRIHLAKLVFEWKQGKLQPPTKQPTFTKSALLVHVPKDLYALDVILRQPRQIELGKPPRIMVILSTGRNTVSSATVKLSAPSGVQFQVQEASTEDSDIQLIKSADAFGLQGLDKEKSITVSIPHSDASSFHFVRVNVTVNYTTASEPTINRTFKVTRIVATSLPVAVNVEDFFRGTRLFTRFTLSTTSHQHVRIRSTELVPDKDAEGVKITSAAIRKPNIVTITPAQPGKFLFQLDTVRGSGRGSLRLHITYRMLREEVESLIGLSVEEVAKEMPSVEPYRRELVDKLVQALESEAGWVQLYGITGELVVPGTTEEDGDFGAALIKLKEILRHKRPPSLSFGEWREISIPVDIPRMHILAAARLKILANPFEPEGSSSKIPLFAGQPISAVLSISTSFHWAPAEESAAEKYQMRYDIEDMTQDWLVSGRKRGDFIAKDGETFSVNITLIAVHHGELSLPNVGVTAMSLGGQVRMSSVAPNCETYQVHGAEKVLVLPRGGRSTFVVSMGDAG